MSRKKGAKNIVSSSFEEGTRAAQDIHRTISDLPFQILENLGIMSESTREVKKIHDESLAAVYDTVREVGHRVAHFAEDTGRDLSHAVKPESQTTEHKTAKHGTTRTTRTTHRKTGAKAA